MNSNDYCSIASMLENIEEMHTTIKKELAAIREANKKIAASIASMPNRFSMKAQESNRRIARLEKCIGLDQSTRLPVEQQGWCRSTEYVS